MSPIRLLGRDPVVGVEVHPDLGLHQRQQWRVSLGCTGGGQRRDQRETGSEDLHRDSRESSNGRGPGRYTRLPYCRCTAFAATASRMHPPTAWDRQALGPGSAAGALQHEAERQRMPAIGLLGPVGHQRLTHAEHGVGRQLRVTSVAQPSAWMRKCRCVGRQAERRARRSRFHGVLAANAQLRPLVVPQGPPAQAHAATEAAVKAECEVVVAGAFRARG